MKFNIKFYIIFLFLFFYAFNCFGGISKFSNPIVAKGLYANPYLYNKNKSVDNNEPNIQDNFSINQQDILNKIKLKQKYESNREIEKYSDIELGFVKRLKLKQYKLRQFGYKFFKGTPRLSLSIPVDKSYILGPGDELFLYIIGTPPGVDLSKITKLIVDREGKVYLPGLGIFYVWGCSLKDVEKKIANSLKANIKLTVGKLRTFPVYVSGEVNRPGAVILTGVNTVIDALMLAGGVKKTGTLRDIIITRKNKKIHIDLYKLLLQGNSIDIRVRDGDVIFVKPIMKTAAIVGKVKRGAIFEFKKKLTLKDLIKLSGGLLPSSYNCKVTIQRYINHTFLKLIEGNIADKSFINAEICDGDIVEIKEVLNPPNNSIAIKGYTVYPGYYEYKKGMKLSSILTYDFFHIDTNIKFAYIKRQFPYGSNPIYIAFSPEKIFSHYQDIELKPFDEIYLFKIGQSNIDFNLIKDAIVLEGEIVYPGIYAFEKGMKLSEILHKNILSINTDLYYGEIDRRDIETLELKKIIKFKPIDILNNKNDIILQQLDVIRFFPRYLKAPVKISGYVKDTVILPYHEGMMLNEALSSAIYKDDIKNLKVDIFRQIQNEENRQKENTQIADNASIQLIEKAENIKVKVKKEGELIKSNIGPFFLYDVLVAKKPKYNILLYPGDRLVIKKIENKEKVEKVIIKGFVKNPGVFKINEKTTLYEILKKTGGFRENAFPEGIMILRKSVAEMQKQRINKAIIEFRKELSKEEASMLQGDYTKEELRARQASYEAKRKLLDEMAKSQITGRLTGVIVSRDLEKLKGTKFDILLNDGDEIIIPKKPDAVLIFGEVYNSLAMLYQKGYTVRDYIAMAGGLTESAKKKNIFVIKSDGSVISSANVGIDKYWEGRNLPEWGKPEEYSNDILDYKINRGDAIIIPTEIKGVTLWRPLIKDVVQIIYQSALTLYTVNNLK